MIVVSPLRRTLQTAYHLFKDHPNFNNIKVVINPDVRETFGFSCDIPISIQNLKTEFFSLFPLLDTSLLDSLIDKTEGQEDLWILESLEKDRKDAFR